MFTCSPKKSRRTHLCSWDSTSTIPQTKNKTGTWPCNVDTPTQKHAVVLTHFHRKSKQPIHNRLLHPTNLHSLTLQLTGKAQAMTGTLSHSPINSHVQPAHYALDRVSFTQMLELPLQMKSFSRDLESSPVICTADWPHHDKDTLHKCGASKLHKRGI
jgi:hypothetical protein